MVVLILKLDGTIDTEKQALLKRMLGSVDYPLGFFFLFGERAGKSDEIELLTWCLRNGSGVSDSV